MLLTRSPPLHRVVPSGVLLRLLRCLLIKGVVQSPLLTALAFYVIYVESQTPQA